MRDRMFSGDKINFTEVTIFTFHIPLIANKQLFVLLNWIHANSFCPMTYGCMLERISQD